MIKPRQEENQVWDYEAEQGYSSEHTARSSVRLLERAYRFGPQLGCVQNKGRNNWLQDSKCLSNKNQLLSRQQLFLVPRLKRNFSHALCSQNKCTISFLRGFLAMTLAESGDKTIVCIVCYRMKYQQGAVNGRTRLKESDYFHRFCYSHCGSSSSNICLVVHP